MTLDIVFEENNIVLDVDFGEIQMVTDGGYEQGYEQGHKTGYSQGWTAGAQKGFVDGKEEGFGEGLEQGRYEGYADGYEGGHRVGEALGKQEANAITLELLEQFNTSLDGIIATQNSYLVITFNIGGNKCTGLYAMRWGDWVRSEYNVYGITVDSRDGQIFDENGDWIALDGDGQFDTDLIEANVNYQAL